MTRRLAAVLAALAIIVGACQPTADTTIENLEPGIVVGATRTCDELQLSEVRCSSMKLRAAAMLENARPGHSPIVNARTELHAEGDPPAGQSPAPRTTVVPVIVVFTLQDGSRIAIPVHCPRDPAAGDPACDPRIR